MSKRNERIDLLSNTASTKSASGITRPGSSGDSRSDPWSNRGSQTTGIKFGSPSNNRPQASSTGSSWTKLVNRAARGGVSGAFGGGGLLGAVGGLGGILSGVIHLFGSSKKTPPPLSLFQLPDAQDQTVYVGTHQTAQQTSAGVYSTTASQQPSMQYHSDEIAQAVKQALLTSSSLNDVIAEL